MNNNILYLVIGALAVATVVLGYYFYQDQQSPAGIQISVSKPLLGDHRGRDNNRDRGHGGDRGGHEQKGPQPNE